MEHEFMLNDEPFQSIKSGKKVYEMRLYDEKRRLINVGDTILFKNRKDEEELKVNVTSINIFSSFEELYSKLPLKSLGYDESNIDKASYKDMEQYYPREKQELYKVVAIGISLIPQKHL